MQEHDARSSSDQTVHEVRKASVLVGVGAVLGSTVLFGSTPAITVRLRNDLTLFELLTYRGLVAVLMLWALLALARARTVHARTAHARVSGCASAPRIQSYAGLVIGVTLYAPQLLLFYWSFDYIETSLAVAIGYVYPTLVILLGAARRRVVPNWTEIALSLLALAGIAALSRSDDGTSVSAIGLVLVLASAGMYAIYAVSAGELISRLSPLRMGVQITGSVAATTAVVGASSGSLGMPTDPQTWLFIVVQAALQVVSISLYYVGLARLGAGRASLVDTAQPLFAAMAGITLLGEQLGRVQWAGIGLVVMSVLSITVLAHRRRPPPFADPP